MRHVVIDTARTYRYLQYLGCAKAHRCFSTNLSFDDACDSHSLVCQFFFSNSYAHADILLHNAQLHSTYNFLPFLLTSAAVKRSCKIVTCEKHEIVFVP